jgi:uncharacterized protein (DUF3820 family)
MAKKLSRNFIAGRMNKVMDERLLPEGEYIDAMNVRMGSTEQAEIGVIENTKGNLSLTTLSYNGDPLSTEALCIGTIEDSANETLYWFVHDDNFPQGATGKLDLIVSFNVLTNTLTYHVTSIDDGGGLNTTLNFNPTFLITGVNIQANLLFFTDDYNAPRFINTGRSYPLPVALIDGISAEQLLVIKKPPLESPIITTVTSSGQDNYMETRFICFAYRYRYADGEYSATSQWSAVAFVPNSFEFSIDSMLNEGMVNYSNTSLISYNSGGPLVVGVDLLFKQSANNIIKVIEKINKVTLGLADNTVFTYSFDNSKIFTILSSAEILRLYDNVPRFAKAQTIMGNRLMYGNYVEGYDLVDSFGVPIKLEYETSLVSTEVGISNLTTSTQSGNYTIDVLSPQTIPSAIGFIDLQGKVLTSGSLINIEFNIVHYGFSGTLPFPLTTTATISVEFSFYLSNNYTSVYQLATSPEFQAAVGTIANIKPVYDPVPGNDTSCDGTTFTDKQNCVLPNNLSAFQKVASGISGVGQGIDIVTFPSSNLIGFQFVAMQYDSPAPPAVPTQSVYEYYTIPFISATFQELANPRSLHSNRGYEIGIVYMDDFNRASTALVSPNNTVHVACGLSSQKNGIRVTIPPTQIAPGWATRYKFVIKPDMENYEVIYTNLFFTDSTTNEAWFFLEGENTMKVEVGDRLIVKADTSGVVTNCAYATVLEKSTKPASFITPIQGIAVLAGVYMKINPNSFSVVSDPLATINFGKLSAFAGLTDLNGEWAQLDYPCNITGADPLNPTWTYIDYSVPAGSRVQLDFDWIRGGINNGCEARGYRYIKTFVSSSNYNNFMDWWNGDNVPSTLTSGTSVDGNSYIDFIPTVGPLALPTTFSDALEVQFFRDAVTNQLILQFNTGKSCGGGGDKDGKRFYVYVTIKVFRAISTIIFETEPTDALPDVFFENNLSFAIDSFGNHEGNVINQNIAGGISGVVDTEFFNCFSFGNGAESYKIRDSIIGRQFTLGERVTSVSAQDYKMADRFADITYSGVYNAESNLNKLNEFNLGLLNYKYLESSFGEIFVLAGRETDVLVLQEDKISYVLAGKNLLSDAAAGGVIVSVPEVLGTQIARTEKYGISFNPESYVHWGANRYFTDVKRGAVIQLTGNSHANETLNVISEDGLRTWFRDEFNVSFNTQKLGAYDPYMNEYVLSTNERLIPVDDLCLDCGVKQTLTLTQAIVDGAPPLELTYSFCVNMGALIGDADLTWTVLSNTGGNFQVNAIYNGTPYTSGPTAVSGSLTIVKDDISEQTVFVTIIYTSAQLVINIIQECPTIESLTIVEVVLTNNSEVGQSIHTGYRYTYGAFIGALQSSSVIFTSSTNNPVVSRYNVITGNVGSGGFPPEFSVMTLQTNKIVPDTFDFDILSDRFLYARTNVLYPNTSMGIQFILTAATEAIPITGTTPLFQAPFLVPASALGSYLYLIWDLRDSIPIELCFTELSTVNAKKEICCDCEGCFDECVQIFIQNTSTVNPAEIYFPLGQSVACGGVDDSPLSIELNPAETIFSICVTNNPSGPLLFEVISGDVYVRIDSCTC